MSTSPAIPAPNLPANDDHHWARSVMERQVAVLSELAEDGLVIAKAIKDEITGCGANEAIRVWEKTPEGLERLTRAWNRAARAVRLSLMLQARLIKDIDELDRGVVTASDDGVAVRKDRVHKIINRIVDRQRSGARETMEPLVAERLDVDFSGDILARPISELVDLICCDLGLPPHWPTVAREPWAQEEIESGAAGFPLAAYAEALWAKAQAEVDETLNVSPPTPFHPDLAT